MCSDSYISLYPSTANLLPLNSTAGFVSAAEQPLTFYTLEEDTVGTLKNEGNTVCCIKLTQDYICSLLLLPESISGRQSTALARSRWGTEWPQRCVPSGLWHRLSVAHSMTNGTISPELGFTQGQAPTETNRL